MSRSKAPSVWRNLTQVALDEAYDQSAYAANRKQVLERYSSNSEAVRRRFGMPKRLTYGASRNEALDIFGTDGMGGPINIFIHGGAWRSGRAADYAVLAEMFLGAGVCFVVPDFDWVQDHDGDLMPITDQIRRAIAWTWQNASQFGGDADRLYLSAHSSGSHMACIALTTDWAAFGLPDDAVKGALLCSGMYDLEPVSRSARSTYVTFTEENVAALSPIHHLGSIGAPVVLACGSHETPEFQRQTVAFANALSDRGMPYNSLFGEGYNHFEILETLASPYGLLGRAALEQMGLT